MPKNLITFEQHFGTSAKRFIIENIKRLKQIGYRKMFLEISRELTPDAFKRQLQFVVSSNAQLGPLKEAYKAYLDMLNCLEANNIPYVCIDPENQAEGVTLNSSLFAARTQEEGKIAIAKKIQQAERRDEIIFKELIAETTSKKKLQNTFPGLYFFARQRNEKHILIFPALICQSIARS